MVPLILDPEVGLYFWTTFIGSSHFVRSGALGASSVEVLTSSSFCKGTAGSGVGTVVLLGTTGTSGAAGFASFSLWLAGTSGVAGGNSVGLADGHQWCCRWQLCLALEDMNFLNTGLWEEVLVAFR